MVILIHTVIQYVDSIAAIQQTIFLYLIKIFSIKEMLYSNNICFEEQLFRLTNDINEMR